MDVMPHGQSSRGASSRHTPAAPKFHHSSESNGSHGESDSINLFSDAIELQRTIAETSPDFILIISLDGTIRYINRALDANTTDEVVGRSIFSYVSGEELARMTACFDRVRRTGTLDRYESSYDSPGHGRLIFDCRVAPIFRQTRIVGLIINASDITHQKRVEAQLRDAMGRASQWLSAR